MSTRPLACGGGAFEDRPRQIETRIEEVGAVSWQAPFNGLVVPRVNPR
jgi:hypothetical protein